MIHADLVGKEVHRPLDDIGRFRAAGPAVGVDERGVRVDARDLAVDIGELVWPGEHPRVERRRDARSDGRQAATEIGVCLDPEPGDLALAGAADLEVRDVVAAVNRRAVALAARLDPLDRPPADQFAREHDEGHVGVAEDLRTEGAADVRADAADLVLRDAGHEGREKQPLDVRGLARHPDRVFVGARVVPADVAADLHGVRDQPLVDDPLPDDDLGGFDRGVRAGFIADLPLEDDVVRGVLVELRRARLGRLLRVDDRRKRLPVDDDRVEGVDRLLRRLGDDRGDALAGPLDVVRGEDSRRVDVVLDPRRAARRPGHRQRVVRDVGPDDHGQDTRPLLRRRGVDRLDLGVGVRAPEDRHMDHALELDVVEIAALAGDEARVFRSLDRGPEDVDGHRLFSSVQRLRHGRWRASAPQRPLAWSRPPRGWRQRCCGSPCSGRCCRRGRGESRRPSVRRCGRADRRRP